MVPIPTGTLRSPMQSPQDAAVAVTFRHLAPKAREVALVGEMNGWDPRATPMARGADGVWSVTVSLPPGQWLYKVYEDGAWLADDANPLSSPDGRGGRHSWVVVGDGDFRRHEGIAHGRIQAVRVPSAALSAEVEANLYLPPGPPGPWPLLVLLHGSGMDRLQWTDNGRVADFMDNLQHAGRVRPLLVAMPSVMPFATHPGLATFLADELPAWLAAHAHALADPHGGASKPARAALGGFSLGGGLALQVAAERPGAYGLWLPIAAWVPDDKLEPWSRAWPGAGEIVLSCGSEDAGLVALNRRIGALLALGRARAEYREAPGGHTLRYLNAITPDLLERASRHAYPHGGASQPAR